MLEQFLAACRTPEGSPHLPWDLLIVDECHNLMPSAFGDDSDLCRMLRLLAPQFEHRLFLSATPHNGHTRSFTGLLEILDPVRFSQTDELKPAEKERVQQVVLRRLKREINARTNPPRFCTRHPPQALVLDLSPQEIALSAAFDAFRTAIRRLIGGGETRRRRAGSFAVEILGKRLLSCPTAFAESWRRCKEGLAEEHGRDEAESRPPAGASNGRPATTARRSRARRRPRPCRRRLAEELSPADLSDEIAAIDARSPASGFDLARRRHRRADPAADARFDALARPHREAPARTDGDWRDDERLVVFTEYKTTLDYLVRRLRERYEPERILTLFGGMDEESSATWSSRPSTTRRTPVRILLATDAAAEGLNLQRTARYLLHFDCPWNPSRLEQRNGRLDRHGQARDVTVLPLRQRPGPGPRASSRT